MSDTTPPKARQAKKKSSTPTAQAVNEAPLLPRETEHEEKLQRLPSQLELATIAAALDSPDNTPDATAERALALWHACEMRLVRQRIQYSQEFYMKSKVALLGVDKASGIPLLGFLKTHFSKNSKHDHMLKKFRDFLRDDLSFASFDPNFNPDDLDPKELEKLQLDAVGSMMQRYREQGVSAHDAIYLYEEFKEFLERTDPETKKERARKGGIARKEKAEAKAKAEEEAKAKAALIEAEAAAGKTRGEKKTLGSKKTRPKQKKAGRKQ